MAAGQPPAQALLSEAQGQTCCTPRAGFEASTVHSPGADAQSPPCDAHASSTLHSGAAGAPAVCRSEPRTLAHGGIARSISHHFLAAYQSSLAQCCAAQFKGKGLPGGDRKVAGLLAKGALQVRPCRALAQLDTGPGAAACCPASQVLLLQRVLGPFTEVLAREPKVARTSVESHNEALVGHACCGMHAPLAQAWPEPAARWAQL